MSTAAPPKHTRFGTQARALFIKNAAQQRRQRRTNIILILYPVIFCILLYVLQRVINNALSSRDNQCGCYCLSCCRTDVAGTTTCRTNSAADPCQQSDDCQAYDDSRCGVEYSVNGQAGYCAVPYPPTWPALMQVPLTRRRAEPWRPAAAMLYTGQDAAAAAQLAGGLFGDGAPSAAERAAAQATLAAGEAAGTIYASGLSQLGLTLGTWRPVTDFMTYYLEPGFLQGENAEDYNASMYMMVADAAAPAAVVTADLLGTAIAGAANSLGGGGLVAPTFTPTTGEPVWEANDSTINSMLYCGYARAWCNDTFAFNEISQAWDFQDTSTTTGTFNTRMWYNATGRYGVYQTPPTLVRVNQGINLATNAFLQAALGPDYQAQLLGLMEMPKGATILSLNFSALLGPLFFVWLAQLLLPTMLASLVYEKEMRLRTMMKMHGLGDGAYWIIQYVWFFILNFLYSMVLIGIGTAVDLAIFRLTSYSYLVVFYFLWVNCLISFAFLLSTFFRSSRTAVVVAFLYTFATGLIGYLLLTQFIQSGHWWVIFLELVPGWALFRGLWEMGTYAFRGAYKNSGGMTWSSLSDPGNGSTAVLIIFAVEWVVFLVLAWYFEQVIPSGVGITKHPLFFLGGKFRKRSLAAQSTPTDVVQVPLEPEDVRAERQRVSDGDTAGSSIVIKDLVKIFPPTGGNPRLAAVKGLTLAVERGECFGLLGPNGAGKSTTINILTGFLTANGGSVVVEGNDLRDGMKPIHALMGVCPQDNLLWEQLTARQHLDFYGRLKGLKGTELKEAVDAALKSVNLYNSGVGDKQVQAYSGGMKRRLSVAISFMGSPAVVYLDEPSTGLDPASRQNLWDVVKEGKKGRGIVLTTHSMEEATVLCDRLGIFVDGQLVCLGSPQELTSRYADFYVYTIMTPPEQGEAAHKLVLSMSPNARQTYALAGTRKYELPVADVTLAEVFNEMTAASNHLTILDWGIANATLEEVFIKFAKDLGVKGGN
ncbi:ABCA3A [Auxenochlorella protothecoides x Auxenochlorella symbiontica]